MTGFEDLAEGCISSILSRTTPVDAGRLSVVSKTFLSAADSDAVWNHFLPSDVNSIISQSPSLANAPSKKALYLTLSDRPIIIDDAKKSFQLDRKSGKKCYMLAARSLHIIWGDDDRYWIWTAMPDSRFPEVANLRLVWWLEIRGMINNLALSPNTQYAAYLVFKLIDGYGFETLPVDLSVGVEGGHSSTKIVCLDPNVERRQNSRHARFYGRADRVVGLPRPGVRSDGWLEIEMGEFNSGLENEEVQMSVIEIKAGETKGNFFLEGIEVRPKVDN
ncbi:putative phloem protein [Medicago truncatula]|uniref:Phloem protein 2-B11 n=1 Tax=Medicago truncatula TaxID=3880 RepID=G8A220_MEDTR|nr:putative F-box protein PP2-B12 [Medicago truncatula]KEH43703.1 phloem protein 2-B11 [Medicago truncatula]RHN81823.1 putative phloem protein [Medicago truncatula]